MSLSRKPAKFLSLSGRLMNLRESGRKSWLEMFQEWRSLLYPLFTLYGENVSLYSWMLLRPENGT
jgi:hypothetical protein